MGEFCFRQSEQKNKGNVLFYETYFEESNINRKHLIGSQDKIITKFGKKKNGRAWFWATYTKTSQKLRKNVI